MFPTVATTTSTGAWTRTGWMKSNTAASSRTPWKLIDQEGDISSNGSNFDGNCACRIRTSVFSFTGTYLCRNCGGIQLERLVASVGTLDNKNDDDDDTSRPTCDQTTTTDGSSLVDSNSSREGEADHSVPATTITSSNSIYTGRCLRQQEERKLENSRKTVSTGFMQPVFVQPKGDADYKRECFGSCFYLIRDAKFHVCILSVCVAQVFISIVLIVPSLINMFCCFALFFSSFQTPFFWDLVLSTTATIKTTAHNNLIEDTHAVHEKMWRRYNANPRRKTR